MPPIEDQRRLPSRKRRRAHSRSLITNSFVTPSPNVGPLPTSRPANEALAGVPVNDLAAGVSTKKLYRNAHFTLERAPRLSVADMNATMTPRRGLRVAEPAAAVGVSADDPVHERTGLLLARARTPSGYRAYEASLRLVRTIAR